MLAYIAEDDEVVAIDYREMAPQRRIGTCFSTSRATSTTSWPGSVTFRPGVPGTVAGLYAAHERYGSLPWARLSCRLSNLRVTASSSVMIWRTCSLAAGAAGQEPGRARLLLQRRWRAVRRRRTAAPVRSCLSLQLIANDGPDAFYKGRSPELIVADMQAMAA